MEKVTFELIGDPGCAGGECPAIYKGSDGFFYIKGNIVSSEMRSELSAKADEDVVRIPQELIQNIKG